MTRHVGQIPGADVEAVELHEHVVRIDPEADPRYRARVLGAHVYRVVHFDPLGGLMTIVSVTFTGFIIGWAKPTPVNPANLHDRRNGEVLVALAGPASNFLMALIGAFVFRVLDVAGADLGNPPFAPTMLGFVLYSFVLFNVLLGQMSLVGPRPSPFRENQMCIPWRDARLSVRPGITGLWQVCRHERQAGDFHQWIHYDLLYVRHMSFLVDLKIVLATLWTLGGKGHVPHTLIVPRSRDRRRRRRGVGGEESSLPAGLQPPGPRTGFDAPGGETQ